MRAVLLSALLAAIVGCGKRSVTTESGEETKPVPVEKPRPSEGSSGEKPKGDDTVHKVDHVNTVVNAFKENRVAADGKYLGKRYEMKAKVDVIGRNRDGQATIGHETVVPFSKKVLPTAVFVFPKDRDAQVAALKKGEDVTIRGRVTKVELDSSNRGIQGYDFHVVVEDCEIVK